MGPQWFSGAARKERPCFAAECGPDPFGHTRALAGPFFDPRLYSICFQVDNILHRITLDSTVV